MTHRDSYKHIRENTEAKYAAKLSEPIDKWLYRRYVTEKAVYADLMRDFGVSHCRVIMRLMRKYNIPVRSPYEAVALQFVRNPKRRSISRKAFIAAGLPPKKGEPNHAQAPGVGDKISKAKTGHPMYDRDGDWYKHICESINERCQAQSDTSIELIMKAALEECSIPFEQQKKVGPYSLDFAIEVDGFQVAVECDGVYWHTMEGRAERDEERDSIISDLGWTVLRFTDRDIHKDVSHCIKVILASITP